MVVCNLLLNASLNSTCSTLVQTRKRRSVKDTGTNFRHLFKTECTIFQENLVHIKWPHRFLIMLTIEPRIVSIYLSMYILTWLERHSFIRHPRWYYDTFLRCVVQNFLVQNSLFYTTTTLDNTTFRACILSRYHLSYHILACEISMCPPCVEHVPNSGIWCTWESELVIVEYASCSTRSLHSRHVPALLSQFQGRGENVGHIKTQARRIPCSAIFAVFCSSTTIPNPITSSIHKTPQSHATFTGDSWHFHKIDSSDRNTKFKFKIVRFEPWTDFQKFWGTLAGTAGGLLVRYL